MPDIGEVLLPSEVPLTGEQLEVALEFAKPNIGSLIEPEPRKFPPMLLDNRSVLAAVRLIERQPTAPFTIKAIAAAAGLSPQHFQRAFAEVMGETVGAYIRRMRLEMAAIRLHLSRDSVLSIAIATGYGSAEALTHAFQRQFGCAPKRYRELAADRIIPSGPVEMERAQNVQAQWRDESRLLGVRFHGSHALLPTYWKMFAEQLATLRLPPEENRVFIGVGYDNPEVTQRGLLRYDCAIRLPSHPVDLRGTAFGPITWPPTRVARIAHEGPYQDVFATYRAITGVWVPGSGEQYGDWPTLETYPALPWVGPDGPPSRLTIELALV
ncbi:AraC family transcriptional regulator [Xanthobacter sp. DSM 24535]|uniref:AraC family transcriptional regulator n=1 Tax=Roseixanthobacter psychrophilus TaxID=3119917 RepID=UPI00372967F5